MRKLKKQERMDCKADAGDLTAAVTSKITWMKRVGPFAREILSDAVGRCLWDAACKCRTFGTGQPEVVAEGLKACDDGEHGWGRSRRTGVSFLKEEERMGEEGARRTRVVVEDGQLVVVEAAAAEGSRKQRCDSPRCTGKL